MVRQDRYKSSLLNDGMALPNINNGKPLSHNDDLCRHRIIILLEVINDAALDISQLVSTISHIAYLLFYNFMQHQNYNFANIRLQYSNILKIFLQNCILPPTMLVQGFDEFLIKRNDS